MSIAQISSQNRHHVSYARYYNHRRLSIADKLLLHPHDLMHKAVGWLLREVGKRDRKLLESYLKPRYRTMPRTMLRYTIEKFPELLRKRHLAGLV